MVSVSNLRLSPPQLLQLMLHFAHEPKNVTLASKNKDVYSLQFIVMHSSSGFMIKLCQGGLCCGKYKDHTLDHAHFPIYETNILLLLLTAYFSLPSFSTCIINNLSSLKHVWWRGLSPPKPLIILGRVAQPLWAPYTTSLHNGDMDSSEKEIGNTVSMCKSSDMKYF